MSCALRPAACAAPDAGSLRWRWRLPGQASTTTNHPTHATRTLTGCGLSSRRASCATTASRTAGGMAARSNIKQVPPVPLPPAPGANATTDRGVCVAHSHARPTCPEGAASSATTAAAAAASVLTSWRVTEPRAAAGGVAATAAVAAAAATCGRGTGGGSAAAALALNPPGACSASKLQPSNSSKAAWVAGAAAACCALSACCAPPAVGVERGRGMRSSSCTWPLLATARWLPAIPRWR